ncbi:MAG TPA: hypothetical protein VF480_04015, partial [Verrucomicrobiae bacterium]
IFSREVEQLAANTASKIEHLEVLIQPHSLPLRAGGDREEAAHATHVSAGDGLAAALPQARVRWHWKINHPTESAQHLDTILHLIQANLHQLLREPIVLHHIILGCFVG